MVQDSATHAVFDHNDRSIDDDPEVHCAEAH